MRVSSIRMTLTKKEILEKIKEVALENGTDFLPYKEFYTKAKIHNRVINKIFGNWNSAIQQAGLIPLDNKGKPESSRGFTEEEIIKNIKLVSQKINSDSFSFKEFKEHFNISYFPIKRIFGGWSNALIKVGLLRNQNYKVIDTELFDDYFKIYKSLNNEHPTYYQLEEHTKFNIWLFERRFNGIKNFRLYAIKYGIEKGIISLDSMDESEKESIENLESETKKDVIGKRIDDRPVFGEKIDFEGLLYAPVNELGVVYLWGILSKELGFEIELIQSNFPDCYAKRRVKDGWQSVKVEFEFLASNFIKHGHDITKCDLIVCWQNDWKDCPIEIIELKKIIQKLKK